MKYLIGGFTDVEESDVVVIDMAPEKEYREYDGVGKYIQADIRKPLPKLPPGEYIEIGRVLRYLDEVGYEGGYDEDDEVNIQIITKAIKNVLEIAAERCLIEIEDVLAVTVPAVAALCNAGFRLETMDLITGPDYDSHYPAEFNLKLTR